MTAIRVTAALVIYDDVSALLRTSVGADRASAGESDVTPLIVAKTGRASMDSSTLRTNQRWAFGYRIWRQLGTATPGALALLVLLPETAHAYLNPGTGALLAQVLLSGAVGAAYYLRRQLYTSWRWLTGRRVTVKPSAEPSGDAETKHP